MAMTGRLSGDKVKIRINNVDYPATGTITWDYGPRFIPLRASGDDTNKRKAAGLKDDAGITGNLVLESAEYDTLEALNGTVVGSCDVVDNTTTRLGSHECAVEISNQVETAGGYTCQVKLYAEEMPPIYSHLGY
jgi:hypothetical protein